MGWADILYPFLLTGGLCGVILLVTVGSSYLWLTWMNRQAAKCPECGKAGAGELVDSEMINSRTRTEQRKRLGLFRQETKPVRVTEETYKDHFKCEHCEHEWTKTARWTKTSPEEERFPTI